MVRDLAFLVSITVGSTNHPFDLFKLPPTKILACLSFLTAAMYLEILLNETYDTTFKFLFNYFEKSNNVVYKFL